MMDLITDVISGLELCSFLAGVGGGLILALMVAGCYRLVTPREYAEAQAPSITRKPRVTRMGRPALTVIQGGERDGHECPRLSA